MAEPSVNQDKQASYDDYDKLLAERSSATATKSPTTNVEDEADALLGQTKGVQAPQTQAMVDAEAVNHGDIAVPKTAGELAPWKNDNFLTKTLNNALYEPAVEMYAGLGKANQRFWEDIKVVNDFVENMAPVAKPITEPVGRFLESTIKEQDQQNRNIPITSVPKGFKEGYQLLGGAVVDVPKFLLPQRLAVAAQGTKLLSPLAKVVGDSAVVKNALGAIGTFSLSGAIENMKEKGATIDKFAEGALEGAKTGALFEVVPLAVFSMGKSIAKPIIEAYITGVGGNRDTAINMMKNYDEIAKVAEQYKGKTEKEVRKINADSLRNMRSTQAKDVQTYTIRASEMEKNADRTIKAEIEALDDSYKAISTAEKEGGKIGIEQKTKELSDRVTSLDEKIKTSLYDSYGETADVLKAQNDKYGQAVGEAISMAEKADPSIGLSYSTVSNRLRDAIKSDNRFEMVRGKLQVKRPTVNAEGLNEVQTLVDYINSFRKDGSIPLRKTWDITKDIQKRAEAAFRADKTELGTLYNDIRIAIDPAEIASIKGEVSPLLAKLKDAKMTYSKYTEAYQKLSKEILTNGSPNINRLIEAFKSGNTQVIKRVRAAEKDLPEALRISPKVERMVAHMTKANVAKEKILQGMAKDVKVKLANLDKTYGDASKLLKLKREAIGDTVHAEAQELLTTIKETAKLELQVYKDMLDKRLTAFTDWRKMSKLTPRSGVRSGIGFASALTGSAGGMGSGNVGAGVGVGMAVGGASWLAATPIIARQLAKLNSVMKNASYSAKLVLQKVLGEELASVPTVGEVVKDIKGMAQRGEISAGLSIKAPTMKDIAKKAKGNTGKLATTVAEDSKLVNATAKGGEIVPYEQFFDEIKSQFGARHDFTTDTGVRVQMPREIIGRGGSTRYERIKGEQDNIVSFDLIESADKGKGHASKVFKQVMDIADKTGVEIQLVVRPKGKGGLEAKDLSAWYRRNGFETNEAKTLLVRKPKLSPSKGGVASK